MLYLRLNYGRVKGAMFWASPSGPRMTSLGCSLEWALDSIWSSARVRSERTKAWTRKWPGPASCSPHCELVQNWGGWGPASGYCPCPAPMLPLRSGRAFVSGLTELPSVHFNGKCALSKGLVQNESWRSHSLARCDGRKRSDQSPRQPGLSGPGHPIVL